MTDVQLDRHQGDYGIDGDFRVVSARTQIVLHAVLGVALLAGAVLCLVNGAVVAGTVLAVVTALLVFTVATYFHTTRVGKFRVWAGILADLRLRGDEDLLDLGCGRGATLLAAAKLLPGGRAVGLDLWRADQ